MKKCAKIHKEDTIENREACKESVMKNIFGTVDNTYNDIREKSLLQWLEEMEKHPDVAVRGGVKLAREYVEYLKEELKSLEEENRLKLQYLKKLKNKQEK